MLSCRLPQPPSFAALPRLHSEHLASSLAGYPNLLPALPSYQIPLLEIHTEDANRRNRRNSAGSQCVNRNDSRCCRYALTVDFVDMGWDFIVAPKVYEANFCNGECPFLYAQKYAHTSLIQKMNSSAQHGPCCGARKLSPMKMLYYDHDHKIKFDVIQDMVVDHCGCT